MVADNRHPPHRTPALLLACAGLIVAVSPLSPLARGADDDGRDEYIETVTVTGSNIRSQRKDFQAPSPIQTLGQQEIADTGAVRVQDIFKGLTVNSGSQLNNGQSILQGLSQFSLRGLGIGSTLTLVNGRRAGLAPITDSSGQLFTDANQFPVNMIERVEVLTDGASSTYGSEAVAGVVNILTRDHFQGLELTSELRASTPDAAQVGMAFGSALDRGHFTLFANYYTQGGTDREEHDVIADGNRLADGVAGAFDSSTGSPGRFNRAIANPAFGMNSGMNPGSGIDTRSRFLRSGNTLADPDCVAAGGMLDGTNCRYHFLNQYRIVTEEDRIQLFSKLDYDIADSLTLFGEAGFSRNEIRDGIGGQLTRVTTNDAGFHVPAAHPFNFFVADGADGIAYAGPQAFAADPSLQAVDLIYRGRILGSDGDGEDNYEESTTRFTNTRFLIGADWWLSDNWSLNASYMHSRSDYDRSTPREWDIPQFQEEIGNGNWNPFGTRLVSPDLVSPKDGASLAGNDRATLDRIAAVRNDTAAVTQKVAEIILSGETAIDLAAGPLVAAIGAQHRQVSLQDIPDRSFQTGNNRLNETIPATFGDHGVRAVFGEVIMPLHERLEIQAAVRHEDYGDQGGTTTDPKISARFDMAETFFLRGSWGTSFKAPSIRQLSGVISNAAIVDPADRGAGNFNITVITRGSENLTPQSAENINIGAVLRNGRGLDLSLDYWTYDYEGLILPGADPQFIFDQVHLGNLPAERATREATGQPATVTAEFENRGDAQASGIDFVARLRRSYAAADVTLAASGTVITEYESSEFGDIKGNRNFTNGFGSTPDLRINGGITAERGNHLGNLTVRHIGSYLDDQNLVDMDRQTTVDLRYAYSLDGLLGGQATTLTAGMTNVFDKQPPRLSSRPFFDTEVHDIRGRSIFVNLRHQF